MFFRCQQCSRGVGGAGLPCMLRTLGGGAPNNRKLLCWVCPGSTDRPQDALEAQQWNDEGFQGSKGIRDEKDIEQSTAELLLEG